MISPDSINDAAHSTRMLKTRLERARKLGAPDLVAALESELALHNTCWAQHADAMPRYEQGERDLAESLAALKVARQTRDEGTTDPDQALVNYRVATVATARARYHELALPALAAAAKAPIDKISRLGSRAASLYSRALRDTEALGLAVVRQRSNAIDLAVKQGESGGEEAIFWPLVEAEFMDQFDAFAKEAGLGHHRDTPADPKLVHELFEIRRSQARSRAA